VPAQVVRRRFRAGLDNFRSRYQALVDSWAMYDASVDPPLLVAEGSRSR
jgi:predicted ABC-type ATPase